MNEKIYSYSVLDNVGEVISTHSASNGYTRKYLESLAVTYVPELPPVSPDTYWYAEGTWHPRPAQPSFIHIWDKNTKQWTDPRTLTDHQAAARERIKIKRDQLEFAPFSYKGYQWDGDQTAQRRLAPLIDISRDKISKGEPFYYQWKTADGQMVNLEAQDYINMQLAKVQQFGSAFTYAEQLFNQIELAQTKEEVEAIQW